MTHDVSIGALLRWRLARAEADAPPAPPAARLLELARPWWERWPDQFGARAERLGRIPFAHGYAMANPDRGRSGYSVPVLLISAADIEASAHILYLTVRDGRLRLRFQLDSALGTLEPAFEATFVSESPERPLFAAHASLSQSGEYRLDEALPAELARGWAPLKVTDRMPFRLILRPVTDDV